MKKFTVNSRLCPAIPRIAFTAFLISTIAPIAWAQHTPPSPSPHPEANTAPTSGGTAATRDRRDTVRSNEQRTFTAGKDKPQDSVKVTRADRRFIEKAARGGNDEVRLARLAISRATDPRVREFAQQLLSDHEKANAELNALAGQKGVSMPRDEDDRFFRSISEGSGTDFDQRFVSHLVDEHEDDVEMYERTSRKAEDVEVAAYASKQIPVLQEHLRQAQELERALKK